MRIRARSVRVAVMLTVAALLYAPAGSAEAAARYKVFVSLAYHYRIAYPASWKRTNFPGGHDTYEVFTAPAVPGPKGAYRASVSVIVERVPAGMTLAAFVKMLIPTTSAGRVRVDRQVPTHISGQAAVLLYGTVSGPVPTRFVNAVFLARNESWRITLTTLPTRLKADQSVLTHMLTSFRLTV